MNRYEDLSDLPEKYREQAEIKLAKMKGPVKVDKAKQIKKRTKYGNKKTEVDGIKFDSIKESRRYFELKGMLHAGLISNLKLQHHFTLIEAFTTPSGEKIKKMEYVADFTYTDEEGNFVIEDVKSAATAKEKTYIIKKKLMADKGYIITEV